jgi:hypothetical protein
MGKALSKNLRRFSWLLAIIFVIQALAFSTIFLLADKGFQIWLALNFIVSLACLVLLEISRHLPASRLNRVQDVVRMVGITCVASLLVMLAVSGLLLVIGAI